MIYLLLLLQILAFFLSLIALRRSVFMALFVVTVYIIAHFTLIGYSPQLFAKDFLNQYNATRDPVTFSLDRCSAHIPLFACRVLYNKPTFWMTNMFGKFIGQYSEENIVNFLVHPYRSFFALFFYIGLLSYFFKKSLSNLIKVLFYWIMLYGFLGTLQTINPNIVHSALLPTLFFIIQGFFFIGSLCNHYGKKQR